MYTGKTGSGGKGLFSGDKKPCGTVSCLPKFLNVYRSDRKWGEGIVQRRQETLWNSKIFTLIPKCIQVRQGVGGGDCSAETRYPLEQFALIYKCATCLPCH